MRKPPTSRPDACVSCGGGPEPDTCGGLLRPSLTPRRPDSRGGLVCLVFAQERPLSSEECPRGLPVRERGALSRPAAVIGPADQAPAGSALQLADCRERKWPVSRDREETVVLVGDSPQSPSRASVLQPSVMDVAPGTATCPWCRQHVAGQPGGRACLGPHRRQAFAP